MAMPPPNQIANANAGRELLPKNPGGPQVTTPGMSSQRQPKLWAQGAWDLGDAPRLRFRRSLPILVLFCHCSWECSSVLKEVTTHCPCSGVLKERMAHCPLALYITGTVVVYRRSRLPSAPTAV